MLKKLFLYGNLLFDYLVINLAFLLGLVLIIPFIGINVGISNYFEKPLLERELKDIIIGIKNNLKIIFIQTIIFIPILIIAILNVNYTKDLKDIFQSIIHYLSLGFIAFVLVLIMASPVVIIRMNVTFKQLIYNSLMIAFGNLYYYLLMIAVGYLYLYFSIKFVLVLFAGPYLITYFLHFLSSACINNLKFKGGTKV